MDWLHQIEKLKPAKRQTSFHEFAKGLKASGYKKSEITRLWEDIKKDEIWISDKYQVSVRPAEHDFGSNMEIIHLSIKRCDRQPIHDWRDLQAIKNQLVGEDAEAIEIYPSMARIVDAANQYHLFCFPPGYRIPIGFAEPMVEEKTILGAVQRPFNGV